MTHEVLISELPAASLAVVRRRVSRAELSAAVRDGCGRAWAFAREQKLPAGRNVAVFWDGSILLDAGVELSAPFAEAAGIVHAATPAGPVAHTTHVGPYQGLGAAHTAIVEWCAAKGWKLAGPNWEIYGHWQEEWNADPSRIRTDVFYQLT